MPSTSFSSVPLSVVGVASDEDPTQIGPSTREERRARCCRSRGRGTDRIGGSAGRSITEGKITMDLRFAVFERIARDDVLRRLLVNYADRLEDLAVGDGTASDTCYLTLEWTAHNRTGAPPEAESLTARAHLPRHRLEEHSYLDFVLRRLEASLADEADGSIRARRRQTSPEVVETGADTIFKTRTYDVTPVPRRNRLPCPVDPDAIGSVPPNGAAPADR
jgi:hypothetical protein